ncbi:hypothetical protein QYE76_037932 [Lolium multiflorum]|uniref:Cytochrome P450 n=1 Tax=Lolium multiflorum TaxID=4521 RepID=A0AAD8T899_LOLMU|nr:hypothetical protein QYE76_037932 [Lolium multiflorum]
MEGVLILFFTAVSALLALCFLKFSGGKSKPRHKLPPGPWTLPIIGSLHHVISTLPHRRMTELSRRYGPVMLLKLGEVPSVFISSSEAAAEVLKTNDLAFASRPSSVTLDIFGGGGKDIAFAPYGDRWRQMRKVCIVELLSARQVRRMEGIRAQEVGNRLATITASNGATLNVSHMVAALSVDIVTRAVFGGRFTQQDEFLREVDKAFALVAGSSLVDLFPSSRLVRWLSSGERHMRRCYGRIQHVITDIIDERKAASDGVCSTNEEDLLGVLLRLQLDDSLQFPLTAEVIGAVLFDIFVGSTDTTTATLEWAMSELVSNPRVMAKAQLEVREVLGAHRSVITNSDLAELHYLRMIIKEVLRLHPPAALVFRRSRENCTIMGYDIPEDTNVYVNVFAVSRDPRYWKDPEEFKPERFECGSIDYYGTNFEFTPFGAGRRQCPGMLFATSTVEIVLTNLLYHFDWMLPDGASLASFDTSEKFGLTISRKYDLELKAVPHVWSNVMSSK